MNFLNDHPIIVRAPYDSIAATVAIFLKYLWVPKKGRHVVTSSIQIQTGPWRSHSTESVAGTLATHLPWLPCPVTPGTPKMAMGQR